MIEQWQQGVQALWMQKEPQIISPPPPCLRIDMTSLCFVWVHCGLWPSNSTLVSVFKWHCSRSPVLWADASLQTEGVLSFTQACILKGPYLAMRHSQQYKIFFCLPLLHFLFNPYTVLFRLSSDLLWEQKKSLQSCLIKQRDNITTHSSVYDNHLALWPR